MPRSVHTAPGVRGASEIAAAKAAASGRSAGAHSTMRFSAAMSSTVGGRCHEKELDAVECFYPS
jgi:hypothetical protein